MKFIADLHIHSPFSRATSKESTLPGLFSWAQVKGINLIGTGDCTHPGWFRHLRDHLTPAEPGLFKLKNDKVPAALPNTNPAALDIRFMLSAEISSIYKRHDRVRKVHNIIYLPDFESAARLNTKLAAIGNLESDGRPILGLDAHDLLEIMLTTAPDGFLVPAHIWTPWFSLFGSKSGFDLIEDCFGDLSAHIFALETGLSSDPAMNRLISSLDRFALLSNSDCHSPAKLGREANIFNTDLDYFSIRQALRDNNRRTFPATIEFFPEEGKYHLDGHRKCDVCLDPAQTDSLKDICPVCQRPLTIGVLHRIRELADRDEPVFPENAPEFYSFIPLPEVLAEIMNLGPATKGVKNLYCRVIAKFGSEFNLFMHTPIEEINQLSPVLGEAMKRIRSGRVIRQAGFDGEFGVIKVFKKGELDRLSGKAGFFADSTIRRKVKQ
ncbi:MAG: endonuclease Q family protein [Proteobacteria bacterium]|nr:endonuclease Q family protein [Pseudomonadota bacterium]MBU1716768.1 endonuclease Q family protein [Pseudomonadota bacterium]